MAHFHQRRPDSHWIRIPGTGDPSLKIGTVTIRETIHTGIRLNLNPNKWKKLCIIQCNDRVSNLNPNPNPSPSPLVEMSH